MSPSSDLWRKQEGRVPVALSPFPERPTVTEGVQNWHMETPTPFWEPLQPLAVSIIGRLEVWRAVMILGFRARRHGFAP